jgi:hypothetical protein
MTARRTSYERLMRLAAELTERDQAMVTMLARVKLATGNQLRRAVYTDSSLAAERAARRELARLVRWRVVARLERRQGGLGRGSDSWTYALDVAGQRLLTEGVRTHRPHRPRPAMWAHALLGAEVYTRLAEQVRGSEQALSLWQGEPECWREYVGNYGERLRLKPDAYVLVTGPEYEDASFVEFDTGSQSRTVIRQKLVAYQRYAASGQEQGARGGMFPLTLFVTMNLERHAVLVDLLGGLPEDAWRFFRVALVGDAPKILTGGAA